MTSRDRRSAKVQYRYVSDASLFGADQTLAATLSRAWETKLNGAAVSDLPHKREWQVSNHESLTLTWASGNKTEFFGELVATEPGGLVPLLSKAAPSSSYLELRQMKVPEEHEPCHGVLYFLAKGNHVLIIEKNCSARSMERYITWFCREFLEYADPFNIILEPKVEINPDSGAMSDIKEIEFRPAPIVPDLPIERTARDEISRHAKGNQALNVIKSMGFQDSDFDKIMEEYDGSGQIEVFIKIQMKHRNKKMSLDKISLDNVGRNFDEDEIILSGRSGTRIGSIVRLNHPVNILMNGSLMVPEDAHRALREAYAYFVANGLIEA